MKFEPLGGIPVGEEVLTVTGSAKKLQLVPSDNSKQATWALLSFSGDDIRWRIFGTDPTGAIGHIMSEGSFLLLENLQEMNAFSVILASGSSSATIMVTYLGNTTGG